MTDHHFVTPDLGNLLLLLLLLRFNQFLFKKTLLFISFCFQLGFFFPLQNICVDVCVCVVDQQQKHNRRVCTLILLIISPSFGPQFEFLFFFLLLGKNKIQFHVFVFI